MHLVGFIVRIYHDARSPGRQTLTHVTVIRVSKAIFFLKTQSLAVILSQCQLQWHFKKLT